MLSSKGKGFLLFLGGLFLFFSIYSLLSSQSLVYSLMSSLSSHHLPFAINEMRPTGHSLQLYKQKRNEVLRTQNEDS